MTRAAAPLQVASVMLIYPGQIPDDKTYESRLFQFPASMEGWCPSWALSIKNPSGYTEYVDRLPVPGCCCNKCLKAEQRQASTAFGTGNSQPQYPNWTPPVHATTADGQSVTVAFGTGSNEGHTLLKDGHADRDSRFSENAAGDEQHDHYGSGSGPNDNGTQRGKYTGYGS